MKCPDCSVMFQNRSSFLLHMNGCHKDMVHSDESVQDDSDADPWWSPGTISDSEPEVMSPVTEDQERVARLVEGFVDVEEEFPGQHECKGQADEIPGCSVQQHQVGKNCFCGTPPIRLQVRTENADKGRFFLTCPKTPADRCHFFQWVDTNSVEGEEPTTISSPDQNVHADVTATSAELEAGKAQDPARKKSLRPVKKYFCPFCMRLVDHFARHLVNKHKDEEEVLPLATLKPNSDERKKRIANIRGRGALIYNTSHELNKGDLLLARRRRYQVNEKKMKPCVNCHNFYLKSSLWKHYKLCTGKKSAPRDLQKHAEMLQFSFNHEQLNEKLRNILPGMEKDSVYEHLVTDEAILDFGVYLCSRHKEPHLVNMIRTKIRQLSKIILEMKKVDPSIKNTDDALRPEHYDAFVSAVNVVGKFDGFQFGSPSVIGEAGRSMKVLANRRIIHCIKIKDEQRKSEIEKWLHIYTNDYYNTVGRHAVRTIMRKKWQKVKLVPLTADIMELKKHIDEVINECDSILMKEFNKSAYDSLNKALMAQIQVFNRKRGGEIDNFEIADFENRHTIQKGSLFYNTLTPSERLFASKYVRVETRGKLHLKPASMLLTWRQVDLINLILSKREEAGVTKGNPYVFGRKDTTFKAYFALRELADKSKAEKPEYLLGTLLRKEIATSVQILNFNDNDLTNLASFLGHDIKTHRKFYRLPTEAVHLAKISRLLVAMDEGKIEDFKGKSLEEINVDVEVGEDNLDYEDGNVLTETAISKSPTKVLEINSPCIVDGFENISNVSESPCKVLQKKAKRSKEKQMKTPPKMKAPKHTWRTPERHVIRKIFKKYISGDTSSLPTPFECRDAIRTYKELEELTVNQIKGWVFSERKRSLSRIND